jgi:transaldolase
MGERPRGAQHLQDEESGCAVVTVPRDILDKTAKMYGMDFKALSLDTVKMLTKDTTAGFKL